MSYEGTGTTGNELTANAAGTLPNFQAGGTSMGSAKAWCYFTVDGAGNPTIQESFNVTSIVLTGGGSSWTVTLTTPFSNTTYIVVASWASSSATQPGLSSYTSSSVFVMSPVDVNKKAYFVCYGT
jgi:hypothetical protein